MFSTRKNVRKGIEFKMERFVRMFFFLLLFCSPVGICSVCISNMIVIVCVYCCFLMFSHLVLTHDFHFELESFTKTFHKMRGW